MRTLATIPSRAVRALPLILALATIGDVSARAHAHGGGDPRVHAVLDERLPAALAGMRVEVHRTVAPQLVVENPTPQLLEVLDDGGIAFLRIGPRGVEANVAARAWFQTFGPGAPVPAALRAGTTGGAPRWVRVGDGHAFGWFEPRLDPAAVDVPHAVRDEARPAEVGRWRIALRVDGRRVALEGGFRWQPPPAGARRARLTSPRTLAPGVRVRVLPGATPGLLIENDTRRLLTVLDGDGEPFLRIGRKGVEANVRSRAWRASGRRSSAVVDRGPTFMGAPYWQRVSRAASYGWIEPRLAPRDAAEASVAWQVPVLLGTSELVLSGVSEWQRGPEVASSSLAAR